MTDGQMLAVQFDEPGGLDVLRVREIARPVPGADEVIVAFEASVINPADVKIRSGQIPVRGGSLPVTLGYDLVGRIAAVGVDVTGLEVGTRVAAMSALAITGVGAWSEYVRLSAASVAPAPGEPEPAVLAQLPLAGLTAWQGIDALKLQAGDEVLVTGAAGAVGKLAVQVLLGRGHPVRALIRDTTQVGQVPAGVQVETDTPDAGSVDAILDTAGIDASTALRSGGRHITVVPGSAAEAAKLIITRESGEMLADLLDMVARGELRLDPTVRFGLRDVRAAHERLTQERLAKIRGGRIALVSRPIHSPVHSPQCADTN
ncbi:alcohol dehydrogenase catalytic domain-containing protein [Gordonia humi]|uniref:NADPH:quinone reductase-like Zn-dependent oxidoreductase n=1 Tax=Gordonia humi TaxID=686429 RepID=A0A840EUW4_9ACTN|nr:NADPH:quinone reductase-like Zn-dependent oxidoreductase [Gordonia humi]